MSPNIMILGYVIVFALVSISHQHYVTSIQSSRPSMAHSVVIVNPVNLKLAGTHLINPMDTLTSFMSRYPLENTGYQLDYMYKNQHNGIHHVYLTQTIQNIPVVNGVMNLNIDDFGNVISFGSSFHSCKSVSSGADYQIVLSNSPKKCSNPLNIINNLSPEIIDPKKALSSLLEHLQVSWTYESIVQKRLNDEFYIYSSHWRIKRHVVAKKRYLLIHDGTEARLVWDLLVHFDGNVIHAHLDMMNAEILSIINWVSDATFRVFALGVAGDPDAGPRTLVKDPEVTIASPLGWNSVKNQNFTSTRGNNIIAQENTKSRDWKRNYRPSSPNLAFDYPLNLKKRPKHYVDASITNLFYWTNIAHDFFYVYGFNEEAGNFQEFNFDKGGAEGDAVICNGQDGSGHDNAHFYTPPDGLKAELTMFLWDSTRKSRDGDLEADIIMHEYTHGVSNRLTGGPTNVGCLGAGESGGLGEGWGDFFGTIIRMNNKTKEGDSFLIAGYANAGEGLRYYPYSLSMKLNPTTFSFLNRSEYSGVHAKGEVWAQILFQVYWTLVKANGFEEDWFKIQNIRSMTVGKSIAGNLVMVQLVVDAMKLQPCNPSFVNARDSIILADRLYYESRHFCLLWKGFASRGLGIHAKSGAKVVESFEIPNECVF